MSKIVTEEQLLAYIADQLSDVEKQRVEKIIAEDPFYQDAIEGLKLSASHKSVSKRLAKIHADVEIITGIKKPGKIIHISSVRAYAVAISLTVFVGVGLIFFMQFRQLKNRSQGQIAKNDIATPKNDDTTHYVFDNNQVVSTPAGQETEIAEPKTLSGEGAIRKLKTEETQSTLSATETKSTGYVDKDEDTVTYADAPIALQTTKKTERVNEAEKDEKKSEEFSDYKTDAHTQQSIAKNADGLDDYAKDTIVNSVSRADNDNEEIIPASAGETIGKLATNKSSVASGTFSEPEIMAEFPGGEKEMYNFIYKNINPAVLQKEIQGTVYVKFLINEKGKPSHISIEKGLDKEYDDEVIRVISIMPAWTAGSVGDKQVSQYFTIPITF